MSPTRSLLALAAVAAMALSVSACGGGSSSDNAQQVIDRATLKGVDSGRLEMSLKVDSAEGNGDVSLSGPFQGGGKGALPELDLTLRTSGKAEGENLDFDGGITLLPDRAYIGYEGDEYEVDPTTFGFVKSSFERAEQEAEGAAGSEGKACQDAAAELEIGEFVNNLENEGGVDVEGTPTTEISGDLDVVGALDQLIALTKNPACSKELEAAGPLPLGELEKAKRTLAKDVKKAHAAVYVGDDDIVRKLEAQATIEPQGSEAVQVDFSFTLAGVNEKQAISAPAKAKPLGKLFDKLDINPLELLEGGSAGLGGLLEGITGGAGGFELPGMGKSEAMMECVQKAQSAAEIQRCANHGASE